MKAVILCLFGLLALAHASTNVCTHPDFVWTVSGPGWGEGPTTTTYVLCSLGARAHDAHIEACTTGKLKHSSLFLPVTVEQVQGDAYRQDRGQSEG